MAHFAKVENDIVVNVIVVSDEHEDDGQSYLNGLGLEGTWVKTSYNANIRGKYAAMGDAYDAIQDLFVAPATEEPVAEEPVAEEPIEAEVPNA